MEIILTGTGSPIPTPERAGPSTLVKAGDTQILVDAGRGVVMRLAGAMTGPPALAAVLITHLHSDHVCALNDVITTHWVMSQESATLKIYGPVGTTQFVERQMHALEPDIGYRVEHHGPKVMPPKGGGNRGGVGRPVEVGKFGRNGNGNRCCCCCCCCCC